MLIAMAVTYPFLKINYDFVARACAPILSIMLMGYLIENYGAMPNMQHFHFINPGNLRALAMILLGVATFELSEHIKRKKLVDILKWRIILISVLCWVISLYYVVSKANTKYDAYFAIIVALGVAITMATDSKSVLFNNRFIYFLGEISLSVYLCQCPVRLFLKKMYASYSFSLTEKLVITTLMIMIVGIAVHYLSKALTAEYTKWYSRLKSIA